MAKGSYFGIVPCTTVITFPKIVGGAAFHCRCGAGEWFPSKEEAKAAADQHRQEANQPA